MLIREQRSEIFCPRLAKAVGSMCSPRIAENRRQLTRGKFMCGIVGILGRSPVNQDLFDALTIIQHRGQDAAGIMTSDQRRVYLRKANGLVRDAIRAQDMLRLLGNMGIGHVRYPTAGSESASESQPFYVNSPYGIGLAHNGNLVNAEALARDLQSNDLRHLNTQSDSEVLLNILAYELQRVGGSTPQPVQLFSAIKKVYQRVKGAFAAIVLVHGVGLLAFRDPHGIRPLVFGHRQGHDGVETMVASESIALDALGFDRVDDVKPGEALFIDLDGRVHRQLCADSPQHNPCIFEYIYLARADSILDNIPVYPARLAMGKTLAQKIVQQYPEHKIDVVIPIPDTSCTAALAVAETLGVTYCEGFVKNRYIGRTFIMPGQTQRKRSVRLKLSAIRDQFQGRRVLLVDDSIVRGTTSKEIILMARDMGAREVYFASAAPAVCFPNVYGIDMPTASELVAHERDAQAVAQWIGADWLVYQNLEDVMAAINSAARNSEDRVLRFEDSIFTGEYVTGCVDQHYLQYIAELRSDANKENRQLLMRAGLLDGM